MIEIRITDRRKSALNEEIQTAIRNHGYIKRDGIVSTTRDAKTGVVTARYFPGRKAILWRRF